MQSKQKGAIVIEGHIQGLSNTRSIGKAGVPVYVVDTKNCLAKHSKYCHKFFKCPDYIEDDFAEFLLNLARQENLKNWVLLPSNDHAVYTISKHKKELEKYYRIITPAFSVIDQIYDKLKLVSLAEKLEIPIPKSKALTNPEDMQNGIAYPLIIKGRNGLTFYKQHRKKVFFIRNQIELVKQLNVIQNKSPLSEIYIQEIIPVDSQNKITSFTAFCIKGKIMTHWTGVKLREHPQQFGTATFAKSSYSEECLHYSKKLLQLLKYTGVCELEYILDSRDNKFKLIEMNPRTWLWVDLAIASGVDYAKLIYDYLIGKKIHYPTATKKTYYWINPYTDTIYSFINIIKGKLPLKSYVLSFRKNNIISPLTQKYDPKPGIQYLFLIFSFLRNR